MLGEESDANHGDDVGRMPITMGERQPANETHGSLGIALFARHFSSCQAFAFCRTSTGVWLSLA